MKVVQSGQGADEVFAGYHWYPPMLEPGAAADGGVLAYSRGLLRPARRGDGRGGRGGPPVPRRRRRAPSSAGHFARPGASTPIDRALRIDTEVMLVDDPVKRVDNMTMAWGLEARVPFLDHDLVELAAACPPELKVAQGGKGVLKEAARRVIPAEVIDRPKGYFPVPALTHLEGPLLDLVRDALTDPAAKQRGLFEPAYVDRPARRPERRADPAAAATSCGSSACSSCGCRPTGSPRERAPDAERSDGPRRQRPGAARTPTAAPMPHRLVGGWDRHDAISTTSWQEPPEHLVASMAPRRRGRHGLGAGAVRPDVPLGGGHRRPTCATRPRARATSASTPATRTCSWPRRPRSCSSTRPTPTGSGCTGTMPRRDPLRGVVVRALATREDADAVNRIYVRCGMVPAPADVLWANQQARHITYLVAEDAAPGAPIGTVAGIDHALAFDDPEGGTLAVDPGRRPGVAGPRRGRGPGPGPRRAVPHPRARLPRPVGDARQRARPSPSTRSSASSGCRCSRSSARTPSTSGCSSASTRASTTSTPTPGSSPTRRSAAA